MICIEVTAGSPSPEEIAAVSVSLIGLTPSDGAPPPPRDPAWARAARLEAQGQAPLRSAADPRLR